MDLLDFDRLRTDALSQVFVDTHETKALFRAFDDLLEEPMTATNGKGISVLGPARCGKTALVQEYLVRCRDGDVRDRSDQGFRRRPLKFVYVPPASRYAP